MNEHAIPGGSPDPAVRERPLDALRVVWTQPGLTLRWLLDHGDHGLWFLLLAGAAAAHEAYLRATPTAVRVTSLPRPVEYAGAVFLWVLLGLLLGFLLHRIGVAGGGSGRARDLRLVVGWSLAPLAASLPFVLLYAAWIDAPGPLPAQLAALVVTFLHFFSAILLVASVREVHGFSWVGSAFVVSLSLLGTLAVGILGFLTAVRLF